MTLTRANGRWRRRAACRDHPYLPPSTWDDAPGPGRRETAEAREQRIATAQRVCWDQCPVREACLDDVDLKHDEGVWGGEDLREVKARIRCAAYDVAAS